MNTAAAATFPCPGCGLPLPLPRRNDADFTVCVRCKLTAIERRLSADEARSPWVDIGSADWQALRTAAKKRDQQKKGYTSSRYWADDPHFVGLCGEFVYGVRIRRKPNLGLRAKGDGGIDFVVDGKTIDVKGVPVSPHAPALMRHTKLSCVASHYVLVLVDLERRRGRIVGWATRDELLNAPVEEFGYGPTRTLRTLHEGLP